MMNGPNSIEQHGGKIALSKTNEVVRQAPTPMLLQLGANEENATSSFSFSIVWRALRQRLMLALPLGVLLSAGACAALWKITETNYRSTAVLRIVDKQPYLAFQTSEHSAGFAQTQIELLRGHVIIGRALESEGLMQLPEFKEIAGKEDPILWVQKRLKALRIGNSELYEVAFLTRNPESARKVVEAIVDVYMRFQSSEADAQRQRMLELLTEEQVVRDREIELKREKLRELAKQAGGDDAVVMDSQAGKGSPRMLGRFAVLSNLQQRLVDSEVEIELSRANLAALREEATAPIRISDDDIDAAIANDPQMARLAREAKFKRETLQAIDPKATRYAQIEGEALKAEAELAAKTADMRPALVKEAEEKIATQRRVALAEAEAEFATQQKLTSLVHEKIDAERAQQSEHGDKSLELEFARTELQKSEEVRGRIADRAVHLMTESRAPGQVQIVQNAKLPDFAHGSSLIKKLGMVGGAAFFAPFVLLIGWDLVFRRVFEREQLQNQFDDTVISEVAALPSRPVLARLRGRRAYELQSNLFEESVNSLRATLSCDDKLRDCRVFVVASAVSGEGKTNLSSQLAMSWSHSMTSGKTIIVDADLRLPNIHDLFEVAPTPGLAEVLRGEIEIEDAVTMDWGDRLFVMPAGDAGTRSPSHLFAGARFREIVAQLRATYDIVIFDIPPILCASEALLITKEADGVLICARHDYSRIGQIKQAHDRLTAAGVNVVGVVLNGAPVRRYSYSYTS